MYQVRKLFDNIYTFEEGNRCRSFLYIGTDKAMMVDSGNGLVDFKKEIPKLTDLPVFLVNTHNDPDHIGRNDQFDIRYIHEKDFDELKERRPYPDEKYIFIDEGDTFDVGGAVFKVIHCPGHTRGHICLYEENQKIMFIGDLLTSRNTFWFHPATDYEETARTCHKLMDMDLQVDILLSCHDECPIYNFRDLNYHDLLHDSCVALERYLAGEPETDIFHLKKGLHDRLTKRYIYQSASILTEVVEVLKDEDVGR